MQKIESWKSKLLDLSKKNRLLNYKETKRSSLKILNPECFELFESFVKNEEPLIFPSVVEPTTRMKQIMFKKNMTIQ